MTPSRAFVLALLLASSAGAPAQKVLPEPGSELVPAPPERPRVGVMATVRQPRPFGYVLGDVVTQQVQLQPGWSPPVPAALPPGRISAWLERRPIATHVDADGRRWVDISYQIVNAPRTLTAISLPALVMPLAAGPVQNIPAQVISVAPLTPEKALERGGLVDIRADRAPPLADTIPVRHRLLGWLAALAATVALWAAWWGWRNWRDARRLPFARAWLALRRQGAGSPDAWLALHRALNETAGTALRGATLPELFVRAPYLAPLAERLAEFYRQSDARFFAPSAPHAGFPLQALARDLWQAERRARR